MRGTRPDHRLPTPRRALLSGVLGLLLGTARVDAQVPSEFAARRLLIDRARRAQSRGDHASALGLATSALQIQSSASLLLFIAESQVALGRAVEALGNVERCLLAAQVERAEPVVAQNCRLLQARLRPRVAALAVRCTPSATRISVDGAEPVPCGVVALTPGAHRVVAQLPGFAPQTVEVTLVGGEVRPETITLAPEVAPTPEVARSDQASPEPPPPEPVVAAPAARPPLTSTSTLPRRGAPTGAIVLGAGGLVLLALSPLIFYARDQAVKSCVWTDGDALACPDAAALVDANLGNDVLHPAAIVGVAVGGTAVLGALLWALRAPSAPTVRAVVSATAGAVIVEGRF